ncbi:MAG: SufS family cysteine desulfurase [Candidatus Paceibacterota bacterium]|jgi:cysteine desulfurase/selenocysteine lyase|nr:SufS family cysteine desulfurase [Candidatus Paceibacterota bacterium]
MLDTETIKKDFPIFSGKNGKNPASPRLRRASKLVYLDNSATSQTPAFVVNAEVEYYKKYRANVARGLYPLSVKATAAYDEARAKVAKFIGAGTREVIFTASATASSNMLAYALENSGFFREGDEIVTTIMEHHSMLVPLQELAKRKKLKLKIISMTPERELDYSEAEKLITKKTKLVAFTAVSNVTGTINDMKRLVLLAKKVGAYSAIDATQAVGHMPVDVKAIDCDFLFFSGHKMCGPTGIGALYGKKELLEKLHPGFFGGGMVEEVIGNDTFFATSPSKFEAGTPNIAGAIGFGAACDYLDNIGMAKIEKHIREITRYALVKMAKIQGLTLYSELNAEKNAGVISFLVHGAHPHDTSEILARHGIATRAGHHCAQPLVKAMGEYAVTRASFYLYNSKEDVDELIKGIGEVKKVFN